MSASIGVGVVVRDSGGRLLLGLRDKPDEPTVWCLPGGAVDPGESLEDVAVRELAEETGLRAVAVEVVGLGLAEGPSTALTAAVVARGVEGQPKVLEPHVFRSWHWFADDRLPASLFPATRMVLDIAAGVYPRGAVASYDLRRR